MVHITNLTRISLWLFLSAAAGSLLIFASAYLYLSPKLPSVDVLKDVQLQTPLRVYTTDGQLMGEFGEQRRTPIQFEQIPPQFIHALLSAEDDRFYSHHGVDIRGLLRAVSRLLIAGEKQGGGSTITMQVARNYLLSFEQTFLRKFNEILLALKMERELSKDQILELYLNKVFFGNRAYGAEAASQVYYGKPLDELTLPQHAMLVAVLPAPSYFNPLVNPSRAAERRDWIIGRMNKLGYIDQQTYQQAISNPITAKRHGAIIEVSAPYLAEMTRKEIIAKFGNQAYTAGYRVFTTINTQYQQAAQQAVIDGLLAYDQRHGYRGPEANYFYDDIDVETQYSRWLSILEHTASPADLEPAIVSQLHEQAFTALFANGEERTIEWQHGLKDKRSYRTPNQLGPRPKEVTDLVQVGDLIRLKQMDDESWHLTQLPKAQAALVSMDANNGAILSLVGGFNFNQSKFNRVTQATRQPGSNFKPFIYTAALANGYTPASIINDAPIVFDDASLESTWRPTNDSGQFYGPTRLRVALYRSRNLVSIRLLRSLGIPTAINYSANFGFDSSQLPRDLSLALGSHAVTPMQIVSGYSVLANGGYKVEPYLIDRIENLDGEVVYQAKPITVCKSCEEPLPEPGNEPIEEMATLEDILKQEEAIEEPLPEAERVIDPQVAYQIDSMMRDIVKKGTGRRALVLNRNDLAGKTGTTNGPTDAWFSGYAGGVVTTTWLGFDNNGVLGRNEFGGTAALPIWIDYMRVALEGRPETALKQPEGIVTVKIDPNTGLLAKPGQKNAIFETFRTSFAPTQISPDQAIAGDITDIDKVAEEDIF